MLNLSSENNNIFCGQKQLLENRTKASRGEIEMVETLEELKELNKRKVVINYEAMLNKYDEERQTDAQREEDEDEALIKYVCAVDFIG